MKNQKKIVELIEQQKPEWMASFRKLGASMSTEAIDDCRKQMVKELYDIVTGAESFGLTVQDIADQLEQALLGGEKI